MAGGHENALAAAAQHMGDKMVELAAEGTQKIVGGLAALLSAIPGLGGVGEAMAAAASSRGGGDNPMKDDVQIARGATPVERSVGPERVIEKVVEVPATPSLPPQALAMVNAMRDNPSMSFTPSHASTSDLSYLAPPATPSLGPSKGTGMTV